MPRAVPVLANTAGKQGGWASVSPLIYMERRGIGTELVRRLLDKLGDLYMIDVMCDADVQPFYRRLGMQPGVGMMVRRD